jgi:hypothetical protein
MKNNRELSRLIAKNWTQLPLPTNRLQESKQYIKSAAIIVHRRKAEPREENFNRGTTMNNVRHGRFAFFRSPAVPGGGATTIPGSTDLGTYQTGGFSRLTGIFSTVGSMTLQYRMGVHSGNYQVTSSVVINSGGSTFDVLNFGLYVNFTVTAANSQVPTYVVLVEPLR